MKLDVIKLDGGKAGSIELNEALFGLEPRADVLHRVVRWQRARAQAGTHSTLTRAEVSYSTKKIYKQKGTGGARHGSKKAPIFRHGGVSKGPVTRSHAHDLTKAVPRLGSASCLVGKGKGWRVGDFGCGHNGRSQDSYLGKASDRTWLEARL